MKKEFIITVLCFVFVLFGAIATARGATLTVTKIADTNDNLCNADCSLREAIALAAPGDTIAFASPLFDSAQTITLAFGELPITKNLTINGRGANLTTVSADNISRVMRIWSGSVSLNGLKLIGGRQALSGSNNGGGIYNSGNLTVNDCAIVENSLSGSSPNSALQGAGIYNDVNSSLTLTGSVVAGNLIEGSINSNWGAGIFNAENASATITNSTVSDNKIKSFGTTARGAGILNDKGTILISNSTISSNRVGEAVFTQIGQGGGIFNQTGSITILNSTISGNSVISSTNSGGGGISNDGTLAIINGTVVGNSVSASNNNAAGGGISSRATLRAVNTIVSGNSSMLFPDQVVTGSFPVNANNFVGGNAMLGGLGSNGGATQTHVLLAASPAIDAGNSCVLTANACGGAHPALTTDQRGAPRPLGAAVDIGAVERSTLVTNINPSGVGSLSQAIADAPAGDTIVFEQAFFAQPRVIPVRGGNLIVNKNLTVIGPGTNLLTLDGEYATRVLYVEAGVTLNLSDLRITRGFSPPGVSAGGILINGGTLNASRITVDDCTAGPLGGGIYNNGTLNLTESRITANVADNAGGIFNEAGKNATIQTSTIANNRANLFGGGIYNLGTLHVSRSTVSGNRAADGGGIYAGTLSVINNSTVSSNTATTGKGGGAFISNGHQLDTTNTTITNNLSESNQTGGIRNEGLFRPRNTIVAGNRNQNNAGAQDVAGVIGTFGYNLVGNTTGSSGWAASDILNQFAKLAPLGNYGGETQTHALLQDSPAINAADTHNVLAADQRGSLRPISGRADIGAFERNISFDQPILPNCNLGVSCNQTLSVTRLMSFAGENFGYSSSPDNFTPFTFSIVPNAGQQLPPGLMLNTNGTISGMPNQTGTFTFTVQAVDEADGMASVQQYTMQIFAPTAAVVSISGRVLTAHGSGIRNALITLTDQNGNSRTVLSGKLGTYKFAGVAAGETYILSVRAKRFSFTQSTLVITATEDLTEVNFIAQ